MNDLGTRLRCIRLDKHLTVRELAQRAEVSVSYIYAIEAGARGRNIRTLQRIATALGVSLTDLWPQGTQQ